MHPCFGSRWRKRLRVGDGEGLDTRYLRHTNAPSGLRLAGIIFIFLLWKRPFLAPPPFAVAVSAPRHLFWSSYQYGWVRLPQGHVGSCSAR